ARLPEPEPLEQHADPLAALGDPVEAAVEVEVLERGQLAVDERLVTEEADRGPVGVDVELAAGRRAEPRAEAEERRLPGPVGPGHEQEPAAWQREVKPLEHPLGAVPLREPA